MQIEGLAQPIDEEPFVARGQRIELIAKSMK